NEVRVAAHEREPFAVGGDGEDIAGANNAAVACPASPMHHRATRKMPTTTHQCDAIPELERVAGPQLDRAILAHDPVAVGGIEMDRTIKGTRPFHHCRVEMRVRDRDR